MSQILNWLPLILLAMNVIIFFADGCLLTWALYDLKIVYGPTGAVQAIIAFALVTVGGWLLVLVVLLPLPLVTHFFITLVNLSLLGMFASLYGTALLKIQVHFKYVLAIGVVFATLGLTLVYGTLFSAF